MRRSGKIFNFLKYPGRIFYAMFILACLTALVGCTATGKRIRTEPLREGEISGVFTLILYGGNYFDDLETVAFLDREGDAYTFDNRHYQPSNPNRPATVVHDRSGLVSR